MIQITGEDNQVYEFEGEQLSAATSRDSDEQLRWTEVHLWKTRGGKYILQKIGRTQVYHLQSASGACGRAGVPEQYDKLGATITEELIGCPICKPDLSDDNHVRLEQDRYTVHVSETAQGIVESAHQSDGDGTVYLTRTARLALQRGSTKDEALRSAFMVQRVE